MLPFLWMGVTVASLHSCGIVQRSKEMLKRVARDGASELAASFSRRVGMPSQPGLFDGSRLDSNFETSWAVVSSVVRPGVLGVGE